MKNLSFKKQIALAFALACAVPMAALASNALRISYVAPMAQKPEALVSALYAKYKEVPGQRFVGFYIRKPADLRQWMTPALADQYWWATKVTEAPGEAPTLDWDVFVNGNDFEITNLKVRVTAQQPNTAIVEARFNNLGTETLVLYDMARSNAGWRIANVRYLPDEMFPKGFNLVAFLTDARMEARQRS
jgi:predicted membrane-bound dolichyl-phosphate-mannose-protein mannosyltransferase